MSTFTHVQGLAVPDDSGQRARGVAVRPQPSGRARVPTPDGGLQVTEKCGCLGCRRRNGRPAR